MTKWRQWVVAIPFLRSLIFRAELGRSQQIIDDFKPWLGNGSVIDIGTGSGVIAHILKLSDIDIEALDVHDVTVSNLIKPHIYDGEIMPFENNKFETALIVYVLHHTKDPDIIIKEAARLAKRVIVFEDVITTKWNTWLTKFLDSLINLEFFGHPHSNRTHESWLESFDLDSVSLIEAKPVAASFLLVKPINHKMYVLDTTNYHGS